jgi:pimeloyl-ACP methyl ester carboxylesterase
MAKFAEVNGIKISYEIQGEDNEIPLILVSGWALKKEMWMALTPGLSEHFKVITFDNRGCGKSDRPEGPYSLDDYADDIIGLIDYLKIDKANLMGYALGAMIIMHFAINYPDRIDKLVLLNTVAEYATDDLVLDGVKINSKALDFQQNAPKKYFMKSAKMAFHRNFIKELEANPDKKFHDLWTVEDWVKEYNIDPQTPKDVENQGKAMLGLDLLDKLDQVKAETLVISSSHNKIHPKAAMEAMHEKLPNSKLEILNKAGDMAYLSRAPEITQLVIDFLK